MADQVFTLLDRLDTAPSTQLTLFDRTYVCTRDKVAEADNFRRRLSLLIWFTYRAKFPPIGSTRFTTDSGWGCMLRCGQMLLAEAILRSRCSSSPSTPIDNIRTEVITKFGDAPDCPYSIHNIALGGATTMGKAVGSWFGPNCAAQVLKTLVAEQVDETVAVHVAMDGCLALSDVEAMVAATGWKRALLLLVPLRLGLHALNQEYVEVLRRVMSFPESVGAMGGRPNAAHYFIGTQDEDLLFLDPHTTQTAAPPGQQQQTYICSNPGRMRFSAVDPSLCLGFLCRDAREWHGLVGRLQAQGSPRLFDVLDKAPELDVGDVDIDGSGSEDEDDGFAVVG